MFLQLTQFVRTKAPLILRYITILYTTKKEKYYQLNYDIPAIASSNWEKKQKAEEKRKDIPIWMQSSKE